MKNILFFCYLLIVILGFLVTDVDSLFPVDLIRVVILLPATPVVNTPSWAWFTFSIGVGVLLLSAWIGLPRNPMPKPIRKRDTTNAFLDLDLFSRLLPRTPQHYATALDLMALMDSNNCFARLLCHTGATKPQERSFLQKILFDFVLKTGSKSPPWNMSDISTRKPLVDAARFGLSTQCINCCPTLYRTCNLTQQQLNLI